MPAAAAATRRLHGWSAGGGAPVTAPARRFLDEARRPLGLSLRGVGRCLRVAATVAALDQASRVNLGHVREALEFRQEIIDWSGREA